MLLSLALTSLLVCTAPFNGVLYHEPRTVSVTIALASLIILSTLNKAVAHLPTSSKANVGAVMWRYADRHD